MNNFLVRFFIKAKMNVKYFLSLFYSLYMYFYCRYSYALRGTVKKTNEKRLNCRVDIRFADELQSIKVNVKNQE